MKVKINGIEYNFDKRITILNALRDKGIDVPTLCYDERLSPYGSCRLCLVKISGKGIVTSCNNYISDGMEIITDDPDVEELRKENLKLLAENYPAGYKNKYPDKRFHELLNKYGLDGYKKIENEELYDRSHPYIYVNMNRCVNCYNCVRVCEDVIGKLVWRTVNRGYNTLVVAEDDKLGNSSCISCRSCIDVCPSGAIEDSFVINYGYPNKFVESSCILCSATCPIKVGISNDKPVMIKGDESKLKLSASCIIGKYQWENLYYSNDRIKEPLMKSENNWRKIKYEDALNILANKIQESIKSYGPNSIGFLVSNRISLEEYFILNKLAKDLIKTNNIYSIVDINYSNIRKLYSIINEANPIKLNEIEKMGTIISIGDIERHHPAISSMLRNAWLRGKSNLIVIDDIKDFRSIHEQSDIYLYDKKENLINLFRAIEIKLIKEGKYDKNYIEKYIGNANEFLSKIMSVKIEKQYEDIANNVMNFINKMPISIFVEVEDEMVDELIYFYLILKSVYENVNINPLINDGDVFESLYLIQNGFIDKNKKDLINEIGNLKVLIIIGSNLVTWSTQREELMKSLSKIEFVAEISPIIDTTAKYLVKMIIPSPTFLEKDGHYLSQDFNLREVNKAIDSKVKQEFDIINDLIIRLGGEKQEKNEALKNIINMLSFIKS